VKKILIDMHRLGKNRFNGLYIYSKFLGEELQKQQPEDFDFFYYLPKKLVGFFGQAAKYIAQHSLDKFFHRKAMGFDIWHSTTTLSWYVPASKKTKFIFTLHDLNFLIEEPDNIKGNKKNLLRIQKRINRADYIIAISNFALRQARQHLQLYNKPALVIYNGCTYITHPPAESAPAHVPKKPFLFSIGLVQKRKNFHTIIPLLKDNDYLYVIAGRDEFEYKNEILKEAQKYNVDSRVIFTGTVSEEEKVWYYKNCEAFMFPSFAEGFGLPVVEAMYFGKPVFISTEASLPEIGGDAAYYFTSFNADEMKQQFAAGMLDYKINAPVEKIKQQAAKFSFEKTAAAVIEIYKTL
jgi:glycosyltransferase involved in cell wall biosynthesis